MQSDRSLDARLLTGKVLVNGARNLAVHRPFGVLGRSGFGNEGGRRGLDELLGTKRDRIA